jgi:hypothetical protein
MRHRHNRRRAATTPPTAAATTTTTAHKQNTRKMCVFEESSCDRTVWNQPGFRVCSRVLYYAERVFHWMFASGSGYLDPRNPILFSGEDPELNRPQRLERLFDILKLFQKGMVIQVISKNEKWGI